MWFPNFRRFVEAKIWQLVMRAQDARVAWLVRGWEMTRDQEFIANQKAQLVELEASQKAKREDSLYAAVGHALSSWAQMEESLVAIGSSLLLTRPEKAGMVFYSIINFNVWLSLIGELFTIDAILSIHKPKFNKIAEKLRGLKDTRDRLAHNTNLTVDNREGTEVSLKPTKLDIRQKSLKYKPLGFDELHVFIMAIASIVLELNSLLNDITESFKQASALNEKSSQQDPDLHRP